ncbi:MAG: hypothetical protein M3362_04435 [Acidobacteriota bacterium]|nr:hypothetical protein [Acidobacteriota bacterium]
MNNNRTTASLTGLLVFILLMYPSTRPCVRAEQKMTSEEIVAKHLGAIGTVEARSSIKSLVILGTSTVTFHNPGKGQMIGQAVLASEGSKVLLGMQFDNTNYPFEKLMFDGKNFTAAFLKPGLRSTLGDFLNTHDSIFRQGLIGGALSSAWPLLDPDIKHARLEYRGVKKIDGRDAYELEYLSRSGSDLQTALFFDKETFRHVRTEYEQVITAQLGANPAGAPGQTQRESYYKMVEEFSDFKKEGGLTLPHTYKLTLSLHGRAATFLADWTLSLVKFGFNSNPAWD